MKYAYFFSMGLTVLANIAYHSSQKGIASQADPLVSVLASYLTAVVATLVAFLFFGSEGNGPLSGAAWAKLNWATYGVGIAAVGLEVGFLWVYRAGWKIGYAALYSNALVTIALVPVGLIFYGEHLNARKGAGIALTLAGLWALLGP